LWDDTYLTAERRHVAETAAARLLETTTPVTSTLLRSRSPSAPSVATTEAAVADDYTAASGAAAARPALVPEAARAAPVIDVSARVPNPLASFPSELTVRPHLVSNASPQPLRSSGQTIRDRRALVPAAVGTAAIVAFGAIAIMFWPGPSTEAPAVTPSNVASTDTKPGNSSSTGSDVSPAVVATSSMRAPSGAATGAPIPSDGIQPAATVPTRNAVGSVPTVARASSQDDTPVTPVSTPSVAQLRVTSTPAGARVTINGIGWGQTPVTVPNLPLGAKTVRLSIAGYRSQQRTVDLRAAGSSAAVHMALKADPAPVNR